MNEHTFIITLNEQPVEFQVVPPDLIVTGSELKTAAIEQNVIIEQNFVLQEELPNGTSMIIGDEDEVQLRKHLRFTAIAPDDNS